MKTSLIIPAYNEEHRLEPFLESIRIYLQHHRSDIYEIIIIDDGSTDATANIAKKYQRSLPMLRLLQHPTNQGKGAAVQTGVLTARGDYLIFIDADGATDISELPKMLAALATAPIAIGNRWLPGAQTIRHTWLRRLAGWVYRTYMRLYGLGRIDTMCGFKGYHRPVARELFTALQEKRWLFDTEIAYRAVHQGYLIKNFPIRWESKDGSKLASSALLKTAFRIWPLIRRLKKKKHKAAPASTT
ncbi:MAG: dolichyl-phosphate beta-glucosyltransferase [Candidatus Andersenbacteria bacterium]